MPGSASDEAFKLGPPRLFGGDAMPDDPPVTWLDRLRNNVVLVTVLLYLLFNWGFMQLRIPPVAGGGLPVGEIMLLLSLLTINYTGVLGRLSLTVAWCRSASGGPSASAARCSTSACTASGRCAMPRMSWNRCSCWSASCSPATEEPRAILQVAAEVPGRLRHSTACSTLSGSDLGIVADDHLGHRLQRADHRQHGEHPADHAHAAFYLLLFRGNRLLPISWRRWCSATRWRCFRRARFI